MEEPRVISFKLIQKKQEQKSCPHINILVCEETRTISCSQCDVVMDAFEYLRHCCYEEETAFKNLHDYQSEVDRLKKKYHNLNREIERLNKVKKAMS